MAIIVAVSAALAGPVSHVQTYVRITGRSTDPPTHWRNHYSDRPYGEFGLRRLTLNHTFQMTYRRIAKANREGERVEQ